MRNMLKISKKTDSYFFFPDTTELRNSEFYYWVHL